MPFPLSIMAERCQSYQWNLPVFLYIPKSTSTVSIKVLIRIFFWQRRTLRSVTTISMPLPSTVSYVLEDRYRAARPTTILPRTILCFIRALSMAWGWTWMKTISSTISCIWTTNKNGASCWTKESRNLAKVQISAPKTGWS